MEMHITGQHIEITDALRNYVNEKFLKIEKLAENITHVHVILKTERVNRHLQSIAEANLHIPSLDIINASAVDDDMYHAIVLLIEKLERQIQKHKA